MQTAGSDALDHPRPRVKVHLLALGQDAQLLDGGRSPQVEADDQRPVVVAARKQRELHRGGGLARALQPDKHHDGRR